MTAAAEGDAADPDPRRDKPAEPEEEEEPAGNASAPRRRADGTTGLSITNSGSTRTGAATGGRTAFRPVAPFGATCRSPGENGNSSRPNRTTTNSSDSAGSPTDTTWPSCPAICPAASVNTTFGRRPAATPSRIA